MALDIFSLTAEKTWRSFWKSWLLSFYPFLFFHFSQQALSAYILVSQGGIASQHYLAKLDQSS